MSSNLAVAGEKGKGECGVCDGIQKEYAHWKCRMRRLSRLICIWTPLVVQVRCSKNQ